MKKLTTNFSSLLFQHRMKIKYSLAFILFILGIFLYWFNLKDTPERTLFKVLPFTLMGFSLINLILLKLKKCANLVNTFLIIYGFEIVLVSYMFYFKYFPHFALYSNLGVSVGLLIALIGRHFNKLAFK